MIELTGLILTYNEKENIGRTLDRLRWIPRVIVLDSFSTDQTCGIACRFPNVAVEQRTFDAHASQWNYGLSLVGTPWVLALDADYLVSEEFRREVEALDPLELICGYAAGFRFILGGKALRSSIYPRRVVVFRRSCCQYVDDGHTQRLEAKGTIAQLTSKIDHDDRKPLTRWINSQDAYARLEARHLLAANPQTLSLQDQLRVRVFCAPPVMFFYLLLVRGLILDGWRGWFYVMQRVIAECLLSLRILTEKHGLEENDN